MLKDQNKMKTSGRRKSEENYCYHSLSKHSQCSNRIVPVDNNRAKPQPKAL